MTRNDRVIVNSGAAPDGRPVRRTSWGAVIAGAIIALMITLLLTLLFGGIGLNTFNPDTSADPVGNGTGSILAVIITNLVALFIGGLITGRLAGSPRRSDSIIHGLLTWSVLTLATIYLLSSALGSLIGGVSSLIGSTVSTVTQGATAAAPAAADALGNVLPNVDIQGQINQFLTDNGVANPEETGQELVQLATQRVQNGESLTSPEAQEEFTTFLAQNTDLTEQEIDQQVQEFTQQADETLQNVQGTVEDVQETVVETTEDVADTAGSVALWGLLGLVLGAIVAAIGATVGSPKDSYEARA